MTSRFVSIAAGIALTAAVMQGALAAPSTIDAYQRQLATALVDGVCAAAMSKVMTASTAPDAAPYAADNKALHTCLYIQEMEVRNCVAKNYCPSYELWSEVNQHLSPNVSKELFAARFDAHRSVLAQIRAYQKTSFYQGRP